MNTKVLVAAALLALPLVNFANCPQVLPNNCPMQSNGYPNVQAALKCGWQMSVGISPADSLANANYVSGPSSSTLPNSCVYQTPDGAPPMGWGVIYHP